MTRRRYGYIFEMFLAPVHKRQHFDFIARLKGSVQPARGYDAAAVD